ncbi:hypothetical protein NEOKW01_2059 [Nematocida sp. AWRm80]|nr:hypothetical protein NEOKW01_2059 [Nematocida sp. AWRm80]
MEKKVQKELDKAKGDLKEAIDAERQRAASLNDLKQQSIDMEDTMGAFREESEATKNRLWWKSAKWIAIASVICLLLFGGIFLFLFSKIKGAFSSSSQEESSE